MDDVIVVEAVTKLFRKREVLKDINFSVKRGDIIGYLGPNGAGKTTTMRIILGLLRPTSGNALVLGRNLTENEETRRNVGVLLEHDGLYNRMTALENLTYYAQLYDVTDKRSRIESLLEFSGLTTRRNDKVGEFSKGMKRKLALARAIMHQPDILFLDEPSAGLDPEAQKMVRDLLIQLSQERNITIFLNSHDLDEVQRICSRVVIIQGGRIITNDTLENLREPSPKIEIIFPDDENTKHALSLLRTIDYISIVSQKKTSVVATLREERRPSELLTFLIEQSVKVEEIKKVSRSLEDVYLEAVHQEEAK